MSGPRVIFPALSSFCMTHFEFMERANKVASKLKSELNGEVLGFLGHKGPEHLTYLFGAYLAHCPIYHFNQQAPLAMQVRVLRELEIKFLFVEEECMGAFEELKNEVPDLCRIQSVVPPLVQQRKEQQQVAYFISTTGTTGAPKLIAITRSQLELSLKNLRARLELSSDDVYLHLSDMSFDVALMDLLLPLIVGSSLVVLPHSRLPMALKVVNDHKVSVWSSAPSLANFVFAFNPGGLFLPSLKKIIHCGEIFDRALFMKWKKWTTGAHVINLYGPAEGTIALTSYKKDLSEDCPSERLPIGDLFDGHEFKISKNKELLIKGEQVIKNYYRGTSVLLTDGFYNTGDIVEQGEEGLLVCTGRMDEQIKIAGTRYNLLSIEQSLKEICPEEQLACIKDGEGIILFMVRSSTLIMDEKIMKEEMRKRVPSVFVPKKLIVIDELPINASGKLDRQSLLRYLK